VPAHSSRESIPLANFFQRSNRLTDGWSISGTTRFATGFPVTLTDNSDNSLLGTLGNGKRRVFYGPGIENFDLTLKKNVRLAESKSLEFRVEAFNAFNHTQFYGPASVDGRWTTPCILAIL
jgi:hypothetical protein